ncbi:Winged helix DNA-binding protein [Venustampulla echinocandica]|uniref:COP9 signalosome complex subunit 1 n=1 Tax=Venustampulla echinocandica TaxID=2656787 RepID=A0A370TY52_9HELO|nr:Winged helix DNA-binding protein [Venustampulla echinocandica]RDL40449.1 Winged helix DNA-binding protein [Venustampulla echinocandica]
MASAQSAPSSPTLGRTQREGVVTDPPKFDLESYIQNYQGRTRLERLIHIGACSTFLGPDALKLAVREAKAGKDIRRYLEAQSHLEAIAPREQEAVMDRSWVDTVDKQNKAESKRLEAELKGYKNNLIKESIRMGNEDLGKHYQAIGDLSKAFEAFGRMRQDISVAKHIIDVSRHLVEVAVEQRNWIAVSSNVQKIRSLAPPTSVSADPPLQPYLSATEGLAQFDAGIYRNAALSFLQTETGMGSTCATIMSPNDVAIYGGLCALATMDRNELQSKVLDNTHFRTYLELEPHIRKAIAFFVNSRYTLCLEILEGYHTDYLLDIYLQRHVTILYQKIRSKCIVQYFIPFSFVTLDNLNEAFCSPGKTIDKELSGMIQAGELNARINTVDRLLEALPSNQRAEAQREALQMAGDFEREARRRILRMNIGMADLEVKGLKRGGQHPGAVDDFFDAHAHAGGNVHVSNF